VSQEWRVGGILESDEDCTDPVDAIHLAIEVDLRSARDDLIDRPGIKTGLG
jgi:hypothetical protein